jgi:hypothetical protein
VTLMALGGKLAGRGVAGFAITVLAVQVALNAVFDIRVLFLVHGPSDAVAMARLFLVPAWFWAASWMAVSVGLLAWTVAATRGGR